MNLPAIAISWTMALVEILSGNQSLMKLMMKIKKTLTTRPNPVEAKTKAPSLSNPKRKKLNIPLIEVKKKTYKIKKHRKKKTWHKESN